MRDAEWQNNPGVWQAYLTEAATRLDADEVKRRLELVPDAMREQVRAHARGVWQLASQSWR